MPLITIYRILFYNNYMFNKIFSNLYPITSSLKLASFLFAGAMIFSGCKHKEKDKMPSEPEPVEVASPEVKTVTLTQTFPGTLQAQQEVEVVARVNGILKVHVPSGAAVSKGQLIYSIENPKYADAVREAQATLNTAQANYAYYEKQYAAMQKALQADAVSEMEVLESRNNLDQSFASIQNAKAALQEAQTMLGYCTIRAPFDGKIALQAFDSDAYISGEASPVKLNTIYNDATVYAYISVDEKRYAQMEASRRDGSLPLDSVEVKFNVPLQHTYHSKINYSAPDVSTSTGTVTLRFDIDNAYGELKSGMYASVVFPYAVARDALIIRDASIGTDQLGKYVYLVNDSNRVVYTPIRVGELYQDTLRIVESGIEPSSHYVTSALLKVENGMKVKPYPSNH